MVDTTGQPLNAPPSYNDLEKFSTSQIPVNLGTGTDESEAFLGDFSKLMIGMRTNLTLEVSREASDSTNSAFEDMQVWVRIYLRADVQLAKPDQFVYMSGIQE